MTRAKVLVLGETPFVGRHIVQALLKDGHTVSILNRGKSPDELPGEVERLRGDRDMGLPGLQAIRGRSWDACVDVSGYTARQVRPSAETLRESVSCYVFIGTIGVYGDTQDRPVRETNPRVSSVGEDVTEVDGETYARLKVTCEDIVQGIYTNRCTLLRPQIVMGPFDPRDRYSYWLRRVQQGGEMLAPATAPIICKSLTRDVAHFVCTVIENALTGPFNLAGPRFTWAEFMKIIGAKNVTWVATEVIKTLGVTEFELPLFRPENGPRGGLMDVSNEGAVAAGLTLTAPTDTIAYTLAWVRGASLPPCFRRSARRN